MSSHDSHAEIARVSPGWWARAEFSAGEERDCEKGGEDSGVSRLTFESETGEEGARRRWGQIWRLPEVR